MKSNDPEIVKCIISNLLGGDEKSFHAALLVFKSEEDYFEVLSYLRSQHAVTSLHKDFKIFPLLFRCEPQVGVDILINVKYALLFGNFTALKTPLVTHYDTIDDLKTVVERVCPPKATIGVICDECLDFVKVHSQDFDKKVTYYGATINFNILGLN